MLIWDKETGEIIASETVKSGESFSLIWKNSLYNLNVTEIYVIKDTFFEQSGVIFHDPNGKPEPVISASEVDEFYHTGGPFRAMDMSKPFKKITFTIGETGNPVIRLKGKDINLKDRVGFGGRVVLEVKSMNDFK